MNRKQTGTYDYINHGLISHNEILTTYQDLINLELKGIKQSVINVLLNKILLINKCSKNIN